MCVAFARAEYVQYTDVLIILSDICVLSVLGAQHIRPDWNYYIFGGASQ